ncbi:MAG: pilus assembly protein PilP [Pseudomonadales bacterium]|jgi:type IV pilus assembly protein PilP|nr:pilus assembly protein PilP [Pseudomonadales bacterium]MDP6471800.1 pilus assembly protein PilP [Pseudomonadales bacterium]MDP6828786.1 pilus assembly protein PilP [Pseudomonadales bacterium]MDP6970281.1 pilus assembly protein PilP [Pseudomonadales bacterium]|tara:strand:- start:561 stop:1091 length:531 start_codon:yes stop_codon:yes gene_type:complete
MTRILSFLSLSVALSACSTGSDLQDLQAFMDEVDSRPQGAIKPLPPFQRVPPFAYEAGAMRSPFEPPAVLKRVERNPGGPKVTPDFNRVKEFLEQYTIGQLAMVGTLAQSGVQFGLVEDNDGGVHRVQVGDYMGSDHGRVLDIEDTNIELIEIVSDGIGGWVERERTVLLAGVERG